MGQTIEVEVDLTTNHFGYFVLKLCPINSKLRIATQDCFDAHPLYLSSDPTSYEYHIPKSTKKKAVITYEVVLPRGVTCSQCVVQWTYTTGNTWGKCDDGEEKVGCGDQEVFRNCADIQIYSSSVGLPPTAIDNPNAIYFRDKTAPGGRRALVVRCVLSCLLRKIGADGIPIAPPSPARVEKRTRPSFYLVRTAATHRRRYLIADTKCAFRPRSTALSREWIAGARRTASSIRQSVRRTDAHAGKWLRA